LVSIEPALTAQVTAVVKVPVPVTVEIHWLVWPDCTVVGVHAMVTDVMVAVLEPLPPPQAVIPNSAKDARIKAKIRKLVPQETGRAQPSYPK
jgi:hypothetical protein